ncbi:hypothetical protein C8F01DRAFT_1370745 [Mycena amicta]|nr:hypothetical protein C8F01DRAFT_1370745 [Mycena amicta]
MFLRKAFVAFSALVSLTSVETPGVELGCGRSALSSLPSLVVSVLPAFPAADFPPLPVSSLNDKPASFGLSPVNGTAILKQPVIAHVDLDDDLQRFYKPKGLFAVDATDILWTEIILVLGEFIQGGDLETLGGVAYKAYHLLPFSGIALVVFETLVFLIDVPFTDILLVTALLVGLEATLAVPYIAHKILGYGRKTWQLVEMGMAWVGLVIARWPDLMCSILALLVPYMIGHTIRNARKINSFFGLISCTVLNISTRRVVSVVHNRHWLTPARIAHTAHSLLCPVALSSTFLEQLVSALDIPCIDLIPALRDSTPAIIRCTGLVVTMLLGFLCIAFSLDVPFVSLAGGSLVNCLAGTFLSFRRTYTRVTFRVSTDTRVVLSFSAASISVARTASPFTAPIAAKIPFAPQDNPAFDPKLRIIPQATFKPEPTPALHSTIQRKKRTREDKRYRRGKKIHVEVEEKRQNAKRKRA